MSHETPAAQTTPLTDTDPLLSPHRALEFEESDRPANLTSRDPPSAVDGVAWRNSAILIVAFRDTPPTKPKPGNLEESHNAAVLNQKSKILSPKHRGIGAAFAQKLGCFSAKSRCVQGRPA